SRAAPASASAAATAATAGNSAADPAPQQERRVCQRTRLFFVEGESARPRLAVSQPPQAVRIGWLAHGKAVRVGRRPPRFAVGHPPQTVRTGWLPYGTAVRPSVPHALP